MLAVNHSLVVLVAAFVMASGSDTTTEPSPGSSGTATTGAAPAATLPATTTPAPTTTALGEEIIVTPDVIQLGDGLVGGGVAKEDGRTYVTAGHYDGEDPYDSEDLWWFRAETSVLAAFDDAGVELWRTELDGGPDVVVFDGDPWVWGDGTLSRIDSSNGRVLDQVTISGDSMVEAFGSVWFESYHPGNPARLVRLDPDLSTTSIEIPVVLTDCDYCPHDPTAGPDAMWLPLGHGGVAVIDPDTNQATVIPVDDIGHEVLQVAVDGDVAYVASLTRVTSIVDGQVRATVSPGEIWYLGRVDGAFGVMNSEGWFRVLGADDPMVVERRQISLEGQTGSLSEIDGEAWMETGRNFNLRRVEFLPVAGADG